MSQADPRYFELWNKPKGSASRAAQSTEGYAPVTLAPPSATSTASKGTAAKTTAPAKQNTLNVRLDTPGGVTYSPSELSSHNIVKRTFIPHRLGESSRQGAEQSEPDDDIRGAVLPTTKSLNSYDFGPDLIREVETEGLRLPEQSEARKYALSIDLSTLKGRPEGGYVAIEQLRSASIQEEDAPSLLASSQRTTASTRTNQTITTLAASRPDSSLPDWYTRTAAKAAIVPFIPPASFTGRAIDAKRPWDAMRWHGHRALERPSRRDNERGIAAFEDVNGPGRVPTDVISLHEGDKDSATIRSDDLKSLSVADLFVVDPRSLNPLRMVRRVDPAQVLLICNGAYFSANEVAAKRAAKAARDAGISTKDASAASSKEAQKLLEKLSLSSEPRGGIGVLFCPSDDPLNQDAEQLQILDSRFEANTSKRLEAPPDLVGVNSARRAQLRAVLAALELCNWEEEGYDKIVIGVEQQWIVQGITTDIWRWRHTGWKLTEHNAQGGPGENVPDRDLWELIDEAVQKYEKIDCNVRFWHIPARDASLARALAESGALKDVPQRQGVVRWRKKLAPAIVAARERKAKAEAEDKAKSLDDAMHGRKP